VCLAPSADGLRCAIGLTKLVRERFERWSLRHEDPWLIFVPLTPWPELSIRSVRESPGPRFMSRDSFLIPRTHCSLVFSLDREWKGEVTTDEASATGLRSERRRESCEAIALTKLSWDLPPSVGASSCSQQVSF